MISMKDDMGGAATALVLAKMVMAAQLPVRLRVLIPAVENSIGSGAYRPSDVVRSRNGSATRFLQRRAIDVEGARFPP